MAGYWDRIQESKARGHPRPPAERDYPPDCPIVFVGGPYDGEERTMQEFALFKSWIWRDGTTIRYRLVGNATDLWYEYIPNEVD